MLCACGEREPPLGSAAVAAGPPPSAAAVAGPPAFVGHWAPSPASCDRDGWAFTTAGFETPGELSCSFDRINPTDAGYTAVGVCTVGKAKAPGRLVLTLTGQGPSRSLTLNGGPFIEPMALVRCSDRGTQVAQAGLSAAN